jgi:hypothetical protein
LIELLHVDARHLRDPSQAGGCPLLGGVLTAEGNDLPMLVGELLDADLLGDGFGDLGVRNPSSLTSMTFPEYSTAGMVLSP